MSSDVYTGPAATVFHHAVDIVAQVAEVSPEVGAVIVLWGGLTVFIGAACGVGSACEKRRERRAKSPQWRGTPVRRD